jgi:hypothetical protein
MCMAGRCGPPAVGWSAANLSRETTGAPGRNSGFHKETQQRTNNNRLSDDRGATTASSGQAAGFRCCRILSHSRKLSRQVTRQ